MLTETWLLWGEVMKKHSVYKKMGMLCIFIILSGFLIFTVYAMVDDNHAIGIYSNEDLM